MNKLAELRQKLATAKTEGAAFVAEGKVEEARAKKEEVRKLAEQIELAEEFEQEERSGVEEKMEQRKAENQEQEVEIRSVFLKALAGKALNAEEQRAMSGLAGEDGGVIIPQDIQTKINEFKRQFQSVRPYVRSESVVTRTGSRVYEKLADMTPLANLSELGSIADAGNPKFQTVNYSVSDYAGMMKLSNTLLADTPENIMNYIGRWFAKKSVVTENVKIFSLLDTTYATKVAIGAGTEVKDVKKILNVTLDPAIAANAKIYTNQDGLNLLDTLVDGDGKQLLQPDVKDATIKRFLGKEVVVFNNKHLATTGTTTKKAPFIVGDMAEAITFFDRQQLELKTTDVGGDAFGTNTTNVRVIERFDVKAFDQDALVYAQLTV